MIADCPPPVARTAVVPAFGMVHVGRVDALHAPGYRDRVVPYFETVTWTAIDTHGRTVVALERDNEDLISMAPKRIRVKYIRPGC